MKSDKNQFLCRLFRAGSLLLLLFALRRAPVARLIPPCPKYTAKAGDLGGFGVDVLSGDIDQTYFSGWTDSSPDSSQSSDSGQTEYYTEALPAAEAESYVEPVPEYRESAGTDYSASYDSTVAEAAADQPIFGSEDSMYDSPLAQDSASYDEANASPDPGLTTYDTKDYTLDQSSGWEPYDWGSTPAAPNTDWISYGEDTHDSLQDSWTADLGSGLPLESWEAGGAGRASQDGLAAGSPDTLSHSATSSPLSAAAITQLPDPFLTAGTADAAVPALSSTPSAGKSKDPSPTPSGEIINVPSLTPSGKKAEATLPSGKKANAASPSPSGKKANTASSSPPRKKTNTFSPKPNAPEHGSPAPSPGEPSTVIFPDRTASYQDSFQYFSPQLPISFPSDNTKPDISFHLVTHPISLQVSGTEEIGILSFRLAGQEVLWHWEGDALVPDYLPDETEEVLLEIIAVCRGNYILRWNS